ncbi:MAG: ATP-binding protein [Rhodobacteraceae bacterium]|nr:ATP-binding protein [Paracoccaceae bacterium]
MAKYGPQAKPFRPGRRDAPPECVGRDDLIERAVVALDRIRGGRAARSFILYGLRGVGKTVLLNRIRLDAEARGIVSVRMEAPEERSLPALLAPALRAALLRLSRGEALKDNAQRAMRALAGFVGALRVNYQDLEVRIDIDPEIGLADSSDLDTDLTDLLTTLGNAAHERGTALVLFIDELQYVPEDQLASLITALHSTSQEQLPITMVAAGQPRLVGRTGSAKSYAERLFDSHRLVAWTITTPGTRSSFPPPRKESNSTRKPSRRFCARRTGIRTSFRSGASTVGIPPIIPRSCSVTLNGQHAKHWPSWMRVSSACDWTD